MNTLTTPRRAVAPRGTYGVTVNLRAWRVHLGLTQHQLAQASGLTLNRVYRIEHGATTSFSVVERLAKALGISVNSLRYRLPAANVSQQQLVQ